MSISNFNPFRLTRLYADAKASCDDVVNADSNVVATSDDPDLTALNRRLKIQKDRLLAWGLEWSDESSKQSSNPKLDETFARAGLTENVASVMKTIGELLEEVQHLGGSSPVQQSTKMMTDWPGHVHHQVRQNLSADDKRRIQELCKDLTASIDVLYDLSRAKRAIQQGTYPQSDGAVPPGTAVSSEKVTLPPPLSKAVFSTRSYSSSADTLVTPSRTSTEKTVAVTEAPSRIERSNLVLEQEPPPAYGSVGNPSARLVGHLKRSLPTSSYFSTAGRRQDMEPVLVEYAAFDSAYRETGVRVPPTEKLDALMSYFAKCNALPDPSVSGTLNCLGYFDELSHSRYGLVYELPKTLRSGISDTGRPRDLRPLTLLSLLQMTSRTASVGGSRASATTTLPPLELRFRMAHNIVRSFSRLHEENILHRNVNSNSIMFFTKDTAASSQEPDASVLGQYDLSTPYTSSFDLFSEYSISSEAEEFGARALNIYNHPDVAQHKPYRIEHDMYSLGLILLEIGLWTPTSDLYKERYSLKDFKSRIESTWTRKLAGKCGTVFMNVVKDCLRAASNPSSTVAASRIAVSQTYTRMLALLRRCCLLDESQALPIESAAESMQNSTTLDSMVKQTSSLHAEKEQQIKQWTSSSPIFEEPSINAESFQVPNIGIAAEPAIPRLDGASRGASVSEHNPHTLPVSIDEEDDGPMSRQSSRAGLSPRFSFSFVSPKQRSESDSNSMISVSSRYKAAAKVIQRAWLSRRQSWSLKEYKRKVTVIQQQWRKRNSGRRNFQSSPSDGGQTSYFSSTDILSSQVYDQSTSDIRITHQNRQPSKRKLRIQPIRLSAAQLDEWHVQLLPRLECIVNKTLRHSPETVSIDLLCIGETPLKARPTIFVTCSSVCRVKGALSKKFDYNTEAYDLKVRRGKVSRSKSRARSRVADAHRSMANDGRDGRAPLNPFHQKRPLCGASIGAYKNGRHLPPVSYGGVVLLDGEPYGMTVHHLLDEQTDDEADEGDDEREEDEDSGIFEEEEQASPGAVRSSANAHSDASWLAGMGAAPGLDTASLDEAFSIDLEISDESSVPSGDEDDADISDEDDESIAGMALSSDASTEGDLHGIDPDDACEDPIFVTQPAIDDVDDGFFPCDSDRDEDHFASHRLGTVHASSGIRRWNRKGVLHEIDWALLKLDRERLQPFNLVQGGRKYLRKTVQGNFSHLKDDSASIRSHKPSDSGLGSSRSSPNPFTESAAANQPKLSLPPRLLEPVNRSPNFNPADDEYPNAIAPADELASLHVHCFGRTSGLSSGVIGPAMSSVRIYRRRSFARSWNIVGAFGMGGDSGAWVMENEKGRVVGHVLAWGQGQKGGVAFTYFCPMEVLLEDMARALRVDRIALPGGGDVVVRDQMSRSSTWDTSPTDTRAGAERDDDELQFQVNELDFERLELSEKQGGVILGFDVSPQGEPQPAAAVETRQDKTVAEAKENKKSRRRRRSKKDSPTETVQRSATRGLPLAPPQGAEMVTNARRMDVNVVDGRTAPRLFV